MHRAVLAAHDDDGHLAHEGRSEIAGAGDIRLQAQVAPGGALEDAPELGLIVRLVLVDPERHAGQRLGRPGARELTHGREYTPIIRDTIAAAPPRARGTETEDRHGFAGAVPSVGGLGAISGPPM